MNEEAKNNNCESKKTILLELSTIFDCLDKIRKTKFVMSIDDCFDLDSLNNRLEGVEKELKVIYRSFNQSE